MHSLPEELTWRPQPLLRVLAHGLCWLCLGASVAGYVYVSTVVLRQPFHVGLRELRFFDLRVYRGAGWRLLHARALYSHSIVRHLGFTYPPFAALLFLPLSLVKLRTDEHLALVLNVVALVVALRRGALLACRSSRRLGPLLSRPTTAWAVAAFAAGAALWLEPTTIALGYGQVDLLITALVVYDLSRGDDARFKGAAIGLAAAIKLTPLLFLPYLLLSGRRRAALIGAGVFAASIAVSFAAAWRDSSVYWGGLVLKSSRVGPVADIGNQSLRAALARLTGNPHPGPVTLLAVVAVGLLGLWLAVRLSRRGGEAAGFSICAVTALLTSPVTWTHHWTLAIPALLALVLLAYDRRSPALAVAAVALLAVGYAYLPEQLPFDLHRYGGLGTLVADPYVLVGLSVLVVAAATQLRSPLAVLDKARDRLLTGSAARV